MAIELTPMGGEESDEEYDEAEAFLVTTPMARRRKKIGSTTAMPEMSWLKMSLVVCSGIVGLILVVFAFLEYHRSGSSHEAAIPPHSTEEQHIQDQKVLTPPPTAPPLIPKVRSPDQEFTKLQKHQIDNYIGGKGILLNMHAPRNAGATMCAWAKLNGAVPSSRCFDFAEGDPGIPASLHNSTLGQPWRHNETDHHIKELRKHYHMVQWTNSARWPRSLNETDWENPNLLSMIVMRHPLERMISHALHFQRVVNNSLDEWWSFANYDYRANNNGLETILGFGSDQGVDLPEVYVAMAKQYLSRFTMIIDQDCLDDSLEMLSELLHMQYDQSIPRAPTPRLSPRDILQNDKLYEFLVKQNHRDLELYEWAKKRSILQCNPVSPVVEIPLEKSKIEARLTRYQKELKESVTSTLSESNQSLKDLQIKNYLNGNALILHSHITHRGGTTFCNWAKSNGPTPAFACQAGDNWPANLTTAKDRTPWNYQETNDFIPLLRKHFHLVAWEYTIADPLRSFQATNWWNPNLVSVVVMRHPLDRLQSGNEAPKGNVSETDWWDYANGYHTNNYALRTLTSKEGCVKGADTNEDCLWLAKRLIRQFTIVIDQECFDESMEALSKLLHLGFEKERSGAHSHPPAKERIGYDDVYDFLVRRNRRDIELYEWSKSRSIVDCSALPKSRM